MYFLVKKAAKATFRTDIYEEPVKKKLLNVDKNDYQESYFDHFFCVFFANFKHIFVSWVEGREDVIQTTRVTIMGTY